MFLVLITFSLSLWFILLDVLFYGIWLVSVVPFMWDWERFVILEWEHFMEGHMLLGLGAAWKVADIARGSTVVIFGLGTVGLAVSMWA